MDAQFALAPGESRVLGGAGLTVTFIGVSGDSRCPADAMCIQGGDAIVQLQVTSSGGSPRIHELHTGNTRPVRHDTVTIALVELSPYPFSSRPIQPGDYRATLRVTR